MTHFAHFESDLREIGRQLAALGMLCNVQLRDPGIIQAIIEGRTPAGCNNPPAFLKMRGLLVLTYKTIEESARFEGPEATARMIHLAVTTVTERR